MGSKFYFRTLIGAIILIAIVLSAFYWVRIRNLEKIINEANQSYLAGENAQTIAERKMEFNKALNIFMSLESAYDPRFSNGILFYDIGNTFFQLEEYPWAALYYYRAQKLMPRNSQVDHNLEIAKARLGFPAKIQNSIFEQIFFFHYYLSLPERLEIFFGFSLIALLTYSYNIWKPARGLRTAAFICSLLCAIIFLSLISSQYFTPVEAVVVQSSSLYQNAGTDYAKVTEKPILSGSKVQVLDILNNGAWLKILTPDGTLGYVPNKAVRII